MAKQDEGTPMVRPVMANGGSGDDMHWRAKSGTAHGGCRSYRLFLPLSFENGLKNPLFRIREP